MESLEYKGSCYHYIMFHGDNLQMTYYLKYKMLISSISNIRHKPEHDFINLSMISDLNIK